MDQCTHEVRIRNWKSIIESCQQRPAGQCIKPWLNENGICEQSYYYWQRKFSQAAYAQISGKESGFPVPQPKNESVFAEIPMNH